VPAAVRLLVLGVVMAGCVAASERAPERAAPDAMSPPQASPAGAFDSARAWEHLQRQVGFGPRPAGSAALDQTRRYLVE
jgi:hypothetical protein